MLFLDDINDIFDREGMCRYSHLVHCLHYNNRQTGVCPESPRQRCSDTLSCSRRSCWQLLESPHGASTLQWPLAWWTQSRNTWTSGWKVNFWRILLLFIYSPSKNFGDASIGHLKNPGNVTRSCPLMGQLHDLLTGWVRKGSSIDINSSELIDPTVPCNTISLIPSVMKEYPLYRNIYHLENGNPQIKSSILYIKDNIEPIL